MPRSSVSLVLGFRARVRIRVRVSLLHLQTIDTQSTPIADASSYQNTASTELNILGVELHCA